MKGRANALAALAMLAGGAHAAYAPDDPLILRAGVQYVHDSNVLRLLDGSPVPAVYGTQDRGDTYWVTQLGASWRKPWSKQLFTLDANFSDYRYQQFSALNYSGWKSSANWDWQAGSSLSGQLGYSDERNQSTIDNVSLALRDVVRTRVRSALGQYQLSSTFWVFGSAAHTTVQYDVQRLLDYRQENQGAGLFWRSANGTRFTVRRDDSVISYTTPVIGTLVFPGYKLKRTTLELNWPVTAKTTLGGSIGRVNSQQDGSNDTLSSKEHSLTWRWTPTTKWLFGLSRSETFGQPGRSRTQSSSRSTGFNATWMPRERWQADLGVTRQRYHYEDGLPDQNTRQWNLALTWRPQTFMELSGYMSDQEYNDRLTGRMVTDRQYGLNLKYLY